MTKKSGVYSIKSPSGKQYIGGAINISKRWREHRHALKKNKHVNAFLQNAWNKYGQAEMVFSLLIICREEDVLLFEQIAMDALLPCYNLLKIAGRSIGWKHSDATRAGFTAARTGVKRGPMSEETKQKIRAAQIGKPRKPISAAHRARLSEFNKERMKNPEVRKHFLQLRIGKPLTEDHKIKIGMANKGRSPSQAAIDASSAARIGIKHSEERKARRLASYLKTVAERQSR